MIEGVDKDNNTIQMVQDMMETGRMINAMEKGSIFLKMEIDMKENGRTILSMGQVNFIGNMGTYMMVYGGMD